MSVNNRSLEKNKWENSQNFQSTFIVQKENNIYIWQSRKYTYFLF